MAMNVSKGMKKAMKGKSATPGITAGASGGLGRIEKSNAVGGKGSAKIRTT